MTVGEGLAPPVAWLFSVGADSIFARRRLSDRLPPGWEQGAVALPQRPAPQGCLKEKAQSKEDISVPTEENRGKHLIKGKSLLSYPPAPSTASRSPSLPEGGRKMLVGLFCPRRGGYHPPAVSFKIAHLIHRRSTWLRGRGGACSSRRSPKGGFHIRPQ